MVLSYLKAKEHIKKRWELKGTKEFSSSSSGLGSCQVQARCSLVSCSFQVLFCLRVLERLSTNRRSRATGKILLLFLVILVTCVVSYLVKRVSFLLPSFYSSFSSVFVPSNTLLIQKNLSRVHNVKERLVSFKLYYRRYFLVVILPLSHY